MLSAGKVEAAGNMRNFHAVLVACLVFKQADGFQSLVTTTVVEFKHFSFGNDCVRLGAITEQSMVHPLCLRHSSEESEVDGESILFYDEGTDPINIDDVEILNEVDAIYTQRVVEDRVSNPHGEHSEDAWIVESMDPRWAIPFGETFH